MKTLVRIFFFVAALFYFVVAVMSVSLALYAQGRDAFLCWVLVVNTFSCCSICLIFGATGDQK